MKQAILVIRTLIVIHTIIIITVIILIIIIMIRIVPWCAGRRRACTSRARAPRRPARFPPRSSFTRDVPLYPDSSNHSLYLIKLFDSSYPEGNFGGNQLLDGLISLSPLYTVLTNDLHRSACLRIGFTRPRGGRENPPGL